MQIVNRPERIGLSWAVCKKDVAARTLEAGLRPEKILAHETLIIQEPQPAEDVDSADNHNIPGKGVDHGRTT